jgi:hypothetical protein
MAGNSGVFESEKNKLVLILAKPNLATAKEWRTAIWMMISQPRTDRSLQETIYRSVMGYIDNLQSYKASHHIASPGTAYIAPDLAAIKKWSEACTCAGATPCTCGHNPVCHKALLHFEIAIGQEYHRTGTAAGTGAPAIAKRREMYDAAVKRVNNDLVTALSAAITKVPYLAHCKEIPEIKLSLERFGELSDEQLDNCHMLPVTYLILEIFSLVSQGSNKGGSYKNIFTPPDPVMSLAQHEAKMNVAFDQITALKISDAEQQLQVMRAMSNLQFIMIQTSETTSPQTPKRVRAIYLRIYTEILKDMALDPQPFDMLRFAKYKENLRIELAAADLSTGTDIEEATRHTRSVTGKARNRQLTTLDQRVEQLAIQKLAQLTAPRGGGRGRGGQKGGRKEIRGRIEGEYRGGKCFTCGSTTHPAHKCPQANKEAVKEFEEKAKARNQARNLRRLGGECVSDDEEESDDWSEDEEMGAAVGSVKPKACLLTLHTDTVPPHTQRSITFNPSTTVRVYTPISQLPRSNIAHWERLLLKWNIALNKQSRKRIRQQCPILRSIKLACQTNNRLNGRIILHQPHDISIMEMPATLADNTVGVAVRSIHHNNSIVHMYPQQVSIQHPISGPVVDTGAQ